MTFNENTRVKIPAILHLCRLGYEYLPLANSVRDENTNIFIDIFKASLKRLNKGITHDEIDKTIEDVSLALDYDDLGQAFYQILTSPSGIKLIDFANFENNTLNVVTELTYKNGDDEFRPDIILLINGLPLVFIEVKKPNNTEGILAERERINIRFKNKKFKKFINLTQLLVFSNNMEYDADSVVPIQGVFYATTAYQNINFNCFREEETLDISKLLKSEDESIENLVLKDNNLTTIKYSPEFLENKKVNTPTNRVLTSLFNPERLAMLLKYGIAYVVGTTGIEKHIMRYPQFFATKAIEAKLDKGEHKGIIWYTQGSGKTALAFYNVHYLTDYYQKKGITPKFYFIVDRLDLMIQADQEFSSRGLVVHTVNSRDELIQDFHTQKAIHNLSGKREITVVNIQKFQDETNVLKVNDYDLNIQRIYFLDEVHRSYNPNGSFLANLFNSDRKAILIGLTGTPLIGNDRRSKDLFGDYIHKYYYNASIADGYTLKLIREGIETNYRIQLDEALKEVEVLKGNIDKRLIYAHEKFVEPMLDYIIQDFTKSRIRFGDKTVGGMVVCDSADQARVMYEIFGRKYANTDNNSSSLLSAALILYDVGDKDYRKEQVDKFKEGKIDFLFVYNMLLTGFDSKRLKKLYIGRIIKDHNLLQTLTRVNRPYKEFRYGYVVDFADIRKEFDATNKAYFEELQLELGDEMKTYTNLFKSKEEIEQEINDIKEKLFHYDLENSEIFSQQISQIQDRKTIIEIKKALENVRSLYNVIRLYGHFELIDRLDFKKLNVLYNETARHLDLLNLKESLENSSDTTNLLNTALENVLFMFHKVSESELVIADQLKDILRKTREALADNIDQKDPEFVLLYDELKRLFEKKNLDEITQEDMQANIVQLTDIYNRVSELNRKNNLLKAKYANDAKYVRVHKRILEKKLISNLEGDISSALNTIKRDADDKVLLNTNLLKNEGYFDQLMMQTLMSNFDQMKIKVDPDAAHFVNNCLVKEYLNEYNGAQV
ncbi:MAG: type I restriction endonuclease [bacterium]